MSELKYLYWPKVIMIRLRIDNFKSIWLVIY